MSDLDDLTARAYAAFPRRREPATVRSYERPRDPQGPAVCRAAQHQRRAGGLPHPPRASRVWRWSTAAGDAEAALNELRELQEEYQDWHNNLPEFAQDTALAQKLEAMGEYDIESLIDGVSELSEAELPLGFGRD